VRAFAKAREEETVRKFPSSGIFFLKEIEEEKKGMEGG